MSVAGMHPNPKSSPDPNPTVILTQQGASASKAERNWKVYGRIKTPARAAMSHEKADKRVFLYNILQLKGRTDKSAWCPPLIEWDAASSTDDGEAADVPTP